MPKFDCVAKIGSLLLIVCCMLLGHWQTAGAQPEDRRAKLQLLSQQFTQQLAERRPQAYYDLLQSDSPPQKRLNESPNIELMYIDESGHPIYYTTSSLAAAQTISTDDVWPGGSGGFNLDGSGTMPEELGVWDAGGVLATHQEFSGRASQIDGPTGTNLHSTFVAGILIAQGIDPAARGMSYNAFLAAYDWDSDLGEMASAAGNGMQVSSHSYNIICGWHWDGDWYWYGDMSVSSTEDYKFGYYSHAASDLDELVYDASYYTVVKCSGNNLADTGPGPGGGHYVPCALIGWCWVTIDHDPDGGVDGYDCIPMVAVAKNIITVGSVEDIIAGYSGPNDVVLNSYSGCGPTDDGRIKPDIVGNGVWVKSCSNAGIDQYTFGTGSSAAAPNVAGSINLLVEQYETTHADQKPLSSTMKAIVIHTADEAGLADGPDYKFGWGLMNTLRAAQLIEEDITQPGMIVEAPLLDQQTDEYTFVSDGITPIRITLVWTDPPGTPPGQGLDRPNSMLVNDLDVRLEQVATSTVYQPYILDPANPANAAVTGDNIRDNVEQIFLDAPAAGDYRVRVSHKGVLASAQDYSLVSSHALDRHHHIILVDRTGSMSVTVNIPPNPPTDRMTLARQWAIDNANDIFNNNNNALISVMYFDYYYHNYIETILDFSNSPAAVETAINNIPDPRGGTPLANAMCVAADRLQLSAMPGFRHLHVYTDGYENMSVHDPLSPVCGLCSGPLIPWPYDCDPADLAGHPCSQYQLDMVQAFKDNLIANVAYFGQPVGTLLKSVEAENYEPQTAAGADAIYDLNTASATQTDLPGDWAFLKYLAEATGGTFDFICDSPPTLACPIDVSLHWRLGPAVCANASAPNVTPGYYKYSIVSVIPPMVNSVTIDSLTGDISVDPECADIATGPHVVTIQVIDEWCGTDQCGSFTVTVTDTEPWITCPNDTVWQCCYGPIYFGDVPTGDVDGDPVSVSIVQAIQNSTPMPIPPSIWINPDGTDFVWDPPCDPDLEGVWTFTLEVDDGCMQTTCTFEVTMYGPYEISITCPEVLPGYNAHPIVSIDCDHFPVGGFDLLIGYDHGAGINFLSAKPIGDLADYWEYFTYRYSQQDNCGGGCPSGYIRLIGIYDMPDGHAPAGIDLEGDFAELTFSTTEDRSFLNQCFWLDFAWFDCGDNTLSSITGDTLYVGMEIDSVAGEWCLDPDKGITPIPCIVFNRGCVCLVPPEDDRGDINLNGVANEIADAVIFANYFSYGPGVLGYPDDTWYENRALATDINDDGIVLTVADLVYLIRIITGDANPYPESGEGDYKCAPFTDAAIVTSTMGDELSISMSSPVDVGAAAFIVRCTGYEIGEPVLADNAGEMTIRSSFNGGELRVLVFSMENHSIASGTQQLFTVPLTGDGSIELIEVQFSDAKGNLMGTNNSKIMPPAAFELLQNYPNPFNASTTIRFALPELSDWKLSIYNVAGRLVREFGGVSDAGYITVLWNAEEFASGIYFCKLSAAGFSDTRKMILMK